MGRGVIKMKQKTYIQITGYIFAVIAVVHALRVVFGWPVVLGGMDIHAVVSIFGVVVAGYLAYSAFNLKK